MKSEQIRWSKVSGWVGIDQSSAAMRDLVLVFIDHPTCLSEGWFSDLRSIYPNAVIAGVSTSGSFLDTLISDNDAVATAVSFEHSRVQCASEISEILRM